MIPAKEGCCANHDYPAIRTSWCDLDQPIPPRLGAGPHDDDHPQGLVHLALPASDRGDGLPVVPHAASAWLPPVTPLEALHRTVDPVIGQFSAWWLVLVVPAQLPARSPGPEQARVIASLPYPTEGSCRQAEREARPSTPTTMFWACMRDTRQPDPDRLAVHPGAQGGLP